MADFNWTFNDYFPDVEKIVKEKSSLALSLMGDTVEGYAKEDCPVDTGLLRNSITHTTGGGQVKTTSYSANKPNAQGITESGSYPATIPGDSNTEYIGTNVEYAPINEFGDSLHHNVGKAHFLRDAAQNHLDEIRDIAKKVLAEI